MPTSTLPHQVSAGTPFSSHLVRLSDPCETKEDRRHPRERHADCPPEKVQIEPELSAQYWQNEYDPKQDQKAVSLQLSVGARQTARQNAHNDTASVQRRQGDHVEDRQNEVQQDRLVQRLRDPSCSRLGQQPDEMEEAR